MQQVNRRLQERIKSQEEHVLFLCPLFYPDDRKKGQGLRINERGLVSYPMLQLLLLPSSPVLRWREIHGGADSGMILEPLASERFIFRLFFIAKQKHFQTADAVSVTASS